MSNLFNDAFFDQLLDQLTHDPTAALENSQEEYAKVDKFHENATYALLGFLCAYVGEIKDSPQLNKELMQHKRWPKRKPKEDNVTLAATRFAMNALETKTDLYERARIYSKVIDYYLSINLDPVDVPDRLAVTKIAGVVKKLDELKEGAKQKERADDTQLNLPAQRVPGAVAKRSESDDTVSGTILLRPGANGLVPVETDIPERVRDNNDLVPHHRNFDTGGRNEVKLLPRPPSPIQIDEDNDIYFTAGRHFIKFSSLKIGEEIIVTLRRGSDDEGRWAFRAISAEVRDEGDNELLH